ncbi:MAG TPA: hypothetical protein VLK27_07020 [Chthoniobacterales bacterium]|nr:hypothetical protein [Chthoniobacterales bacterium]
MATAALVLLILAFVPLEPVRIIARYVLVAYLPGLAIWKRVRTESASLVDIVLYPSLLSMLPFAWVSFVAAALGSGLVAAGWIAIAFFVGGWLWPARGGDIREQKGDRIAIGLSLILTALLLAIPFAVNSFQAVAWDALLHASIVSRILSGVIPPDSPWMAGQPVNYYWLYHFYVALLQRLTGLSTFQVFAMLNLHALVLLALAGYRVASRLTANVFGRISAAWLLIFGLNAFGWIIFLSYGSQNPDKWYSLVSSFAMVRGYTVSLGSLIREFLDGFPFPLSFAFDVAWLDVILARIQGERRFAIGGGFIILATALHIHPLSAVFLLGASLVAVVVLVSVDRNSLVANHRHLLTDIGWTSFAAVAVTLPYAWNIMHAKTGIPLSVQLNSDFLASQGWSILAAVGLIGVLVAPAVWLVIRQKEPATLFLLFFAGATTVIALVIHVSLEAEYKVIYLLAFGLAPLVAVSWNFWKRSTLTRLAFCLGLAVCVPTNAIQSYCFITQPPREARDPARSRLLSWIREQTPVDAILVEYPWWVEYQNSDATFLYLDRYFFDIGVYGNRRQLIGYKGMLEQWGYRDIDLREKLSLKLMAGVHLDSSDVAYLSSLRAPIIVVTNLSQVGEQGFDRAGYTPIYEDGDLRAYRVVLAKP